MVLIVLIVNIIILIITIARSPLLGVIPGLESTLCLVDLFLGRLFGDLNRNNSEIASQNRAVTMNAVHYLPTLETMVIERRSKKSSAWEKVDSRNAGWGLSSSSLF